MKLNKRDSDCGNSACCDHGRGDDEREEDTESEMDISENLVQDEQGNWHIAVTETQEDFTIHQLERMYHMQLKMLESSVKNAQDELDGLSGANAQNQVVQDGATASVAETKKQTGEKIPSFN